MNEEGEAMLLAVCAEPEDDVARGAFADWLEEHDCTWLANVLRGEFGRTWVAGYEPDNDGVDLFRVLAHPDGRMRGELEDVVCQALADIFEGDETATSASAITNATWSGVEEADIDTIAACENGCELEVTFYASGDQIEDKMYYGDQIRGTARVMITLAGAVKYEVITAEVVYDEYPENE